MRPTVTAAGRVSSATAPSGGTAPTSSQGDVAVAGAPPDPPLVGAPARTPARAGDGCVLVVEDDPKLAAVLQRHLRGAGVRSRLADSGDQALRAVRTLDVVAVVLDVMIPHPDGIEVCRQLRRERWGGTIIAMSARTGPIHELAIRSAGADVFLAKPFPLTDLTAALAGVTGTVTTP